jgi:hypothetical protein
MLALKYYKGKDIEKMNKKIRITLRKYTEKIFLTVI